LGHLWLLAGRTTAENILEPAAALLSWRLLRWPRG
jgi:hypothetical protein